MTDTIKISRELAERLELVTRTLVPHLKWHAELSELLATPPADAADMGGQAGEEVEVVGYTTAGMLAIAKELPLTGRIGARCKADERWNVPLYTAPQPAPAQDVAVWVPVTDRLPQIKQILSEKCTLEGRELPTLYRSGEVIWYDGKRVGAGIVEWFHGKSPLSGVTHWMPLPAAPAHDKQSGGEE